MKTPPLLLGLTLAFWAYQTGMLAVGLVLALLVELPLLVRVRWEFSRADYYRVWDLCTVLFCGAALYCFISRDTTNDLMEFFQATNFSRRNQVMNNAFATAFIFFQWMPLVFFPAVLMQALAVNPAMPHSTFSWVWRRKLKAAGGTDSGSIQIGPLYFLITLFATALVNERDPVFFVGLSCLVLYALWWARPRRFSAAVWLPFALTVVVVAHCGQIGLQRLQGVVETNFSQWLARLVNRGTNPSESRTAIGRIGRLKLSGKIVARVETDGRPVGLLREASYDVFINPSWFVSRNPFQEAISEGDATTWKLLPEKIVPHRLAVSMYFPRGNGVVPVPPGTGELSDLLAASLRTNQYGAVRVTEAAAFARYQARYGPGPTLDSRPEPADLVVPDPEAEAVRQVLREIGLDPSQPLTQRVALIEQFFDRNFRYTVWQRPPDGRRRITPLAGFLLEQRAGHCEFFGTATVLLLRAAGIPARYANGYAVQEEVGANRFVVRERHAHAWAIYYDPHQQAWLDLDTTPADWAATEEEKAAWWEPVSDAWSRVRFQISEWRWLTDRGTLRRYMLGSVVVLVAVLVWRLVMQRKTRRAGGRAGPGEAPRFRPGLDSEFYRVEQELQRLGLERRAGEGMQAWLRRIGGLHPDLVRPLPPALALHYRHRFDPPGLSPVEREELRRRVAEWLAQAQGATTGGSLRPMS